MIYIFLITILIVLLSLYVYKESTGYHIVHYSFSDKRLKRDKVKFVFLSDLHNRQYGDKNEALFNDIVRLEPDFIVFGGDMITSCMEKWSDYSDTLAFIKRLADLYPVYYGMGNHEERLKRRPEKFPQGEYERLTESLKKINAPIIDNDKIILNELGITIYGINIEHRFYQKVITKTLPIGYIKDKLGDINKDTYNILIAHNPEHFKTYSDWGADLVLSGHVHGGIIRLPLLGGVISPALKLFPKYDGGLFTQNASNMVLSRGIGSHTVPIRVNNKAELILIELNKG